MPNDDMTGDRNRKMTFRVGVSEDSERGLTSSSRWGVEDGSGQQEVDEV